MPAHRPETVVDDVAAERCPHCDRPLPNEHLVALHVGQHHEPAMAAAEQTAYESARDVETEELFLFHLKVIAAIGVLYAAFVLVYMVVLG